MANIDDSVSGVALLDLVAEKPFESCEREWRKLLRQMKLRLHHVLAIQEILKQGRWKEQPNPLAYVRKAARRVARRMGLADLPRDREVEVLGCELTYQDLEGGEVEHDEKLGLALHLFEQKYGEGRVPSRADHLPNRVLLETGDEVDWERVAQLAHLDDGERLVLEMRRMGFTRRLALEACLSAQDRRLIRSAWRRLERHRVTLERVLKSGKPHEARRLEANTGPEWQMCLMEMEDGKYKIFFRRSH